MLANDLIDVHARPRQIPCFTSTYPGLTPAQGYAAAGQLHQHRLQQGWRAVGRKIGFTNTTIWERYGVHEPIWGTVYDRTLIERAPASLDGLVQPRIEPEICIGLKQSPPLTRDPAALLAAVEWVAHSFEIVQSHHAAWKFSLPDCTAANGLHGRLFIGKRVPVADLPGLIEKLPALQVVLKKNGAPVDRGVGSNVLGSPLLALAYLVEVLQRQGQAPLRPGEIITTGTLTDAHAVSAGETWSTELSGIDLPGLELRFA